MIKLGCDIVYMPRLLKQIENDKFLNKVLTTNELDLFNELSNERRKLEFLCGRFAAKEAYSKAVGLGIGKIDFLDFEVLRDKNNKPINELASISISHDQDYTMAVVILNE